MAIYDLSRCELGETWRDDDGTISTAVYNLVFNLDREEFEKFSLMVRQTRQRLGTAGERRQTDNEGDPDPLATSELGQTFLEANGEITVMLYNFSFCLAPEEFASFADMIARTDRLLSEEFPPE